MSDLVDNVALCFKQHAEQRVEIDRLRTRLLVATDEIERLRAKHAARHRGAEEEIAAAQQERDEARRLRQEEYEIATVRLQQALDAATTLARERDELRQEKATDAWHTGWQEAVWRMQQAERERDDWHTLADARSAEIVRVMGERDEARRDAENETAHREACHEEYVRACAERDEAQRWQTWHDEKAEQCRELARQLLDAERERDEAVKMLTEEQHQHANTQRAYQRANQSALDWKAMWEQTQDRLNAMSKLRMEISWTNIPELRDEIEQLRAVAQDTAELIKLLEECRYILVDVMKVEGISGTMNWDALAAFVERLDAILEKRDA